MDFNVEQHTAYANNYNEGNNGKLVPITPIPTVPASLFSSHYKSADDIKNISKPKVAVPNDPANTARAYVLLQKIGWITLKDGVNLSTVTSEDINSNPYNIQFTEMKSLNIPQVQDDFDFVIITGSIVYKAISSTCIPDWYISRARCSFSSCFIVRTSTIFFSGLS